MIKIVDGSLRRETTMQGQKISFLTRDIQEVDRVIAEHGKKPLQVKIEPVKHARSLDANAYCWVLCDRIASVLRSSKKEVYRRAIREVGVYRDVAVQAGAPVRELISSWTAKGIGWTAEAFDSALTDLQGGKMTRVRLYVGSHVYDSKEMARLIDWLTEEGKELGIETLPDDEIARMLAAVDD